MLSFLQVKNHLKRTSIAFSLIGFSMTLNGPSVYAMKEEDPLYTRIMKTVSKPEEPLDLEYLNTLSKDDPIDTNSLCSEVKYLEYRMNPMVLAICAGDVEQVKQFVSSKMDPNDPVFNVWNPRFQQHYSLAHVVLDPYYLFSFEKENDVTKVSGPAYLPNFYSINPASRLAIIDVLAATGGYTYRFDSLTGTNEPLDAKTIRVFTKDYHLYLQKNNGEETLVPQDSKNYYDRNRIYDKEFLRYPHKIREMALEIQHRQSIIEALSNGAKLKYLFQEHPPEWDNTTDISLCWYNNISFFVSYYPHDFEQSVSLKRDQKILSEEWESSSSNLSSSDLIELLLDGPEPRLGGEDRQALVQFASVNGCIPYEIDFNCSLPDNQFPFYLKNKYEYKHQHQARKHRTPLQAGLNSQGYLLENVLVWDNKFMTQCLARAVFYGGSLRSITDRIMRSDKPIAKEVLRQISEGELNLLSSQEYREQKKEDIIKHLDKINGWF